MESCQAAITFSTLVGAGIGLAATVLFILAAAFPKGASRRRHFLWLLVAVAVWGAYRTGADFVSCYAAAVSLAAAVLVGLALLAFIAVAAAQIGTRSVR
jgi:RsiW-degrading membrane proteinase PrsW (M82 family)